MKFASLGSRYLLGLIYLVFGLNGFLMFIPIPPMPEGAVAFMQAMMGTGYLLMVVKVVEVLGGILLLSGFAFPFALILLAPITVNIFLFHLFLTPGLTGVAMPFLMVVMHVILGISQWHHFKGLFSAKA